VFTQNVPGLESPAGGGSAIQLSGRDKFPNPFCDIASEYFPSDVPTLF
jgi:hypothetical protein